MNNLGKAWRDNDATIAKQITKQEDIQQYINKQTFKDN